MRRFRFSSVVLVVTILLTARCNTGSLLDHFVDAGEDAAIVTDGCPGGDCEAESCEDIVCGPGMRCVEGICVDQGDPCAGVVCQNPGDVCSAGACISGESDTDGDGSLARDDCDDTDPDVYPGAIETCNERDDDCDREVDEDFDEDGDGWPTCEVGDPPMSDCDDSDSEVYPHATETCDGRDEDCDEDVDEDSVDPEACGDVEGECQAGVTICADGEVQCEGAVGPADEVCDGRDNDCDGVVDNDPTDIGMVCGTDEGVCRTGLEVCQAGSIVCEGERGPSAEVCDGRDNDCDGRVDNRPSDVGEECGSDVGECHTGVTACQSGAVVCTGETGPSTELCDERDNDCDDAVDEGISSRSCTGACGSGTERCVAGSWECDAPETGTCVAGATQQRPCDCGFETRTCSATCSWQSWGSCSHGPCTGGDACCDNECVMEIDNCGSCGATCPSGYRANCCPDGSGSAVCCSDGWGICCYRAAHGAFCCNADFPVCGDDGLCHPS